MANKTKLHVLHSLNLKMFQLNYLISCNVLHILVFRMFSTLSSSICGHPTWPTPSWRWFPLRSVTVNTRWWCGRCSILCILYSTGIRINHIIWQVLDRVVGSVTSDITSCSSDNVSLMNVQSRYTAHIEWSDIISVVTPGYLRSVLDSGSSCLSTCHSRRHGTNWQRLYIARSLLSLKLWVPQRYFLSHRLSRQWRIVVCPFGQSADHHQY